MTEHDILRLFSGPYPVSAAINDVHGTEAKPAWRHPALSATIAVWVREGLLRDFEQRESPLTAERVMGFLLELTTEGRELVGLPPLIPVETIVLVREKPKSKKAARQEMTRSLFD